jgi:hypothetical protein
MEWRTIFLTPKVPREHLSSAADAAMVKLDPEPMS